MKTSAKLYYIHIAKAISSYIHQISFINPYLLGMFVFLLLYIRLCSNDSNIDGDAYFNKGEYAKALECYNEFLMLNPQHEKTLYNRGRCFDELGLPEKAAKDYEVVLKQDPDNVKALVSLSLYYYNHEDYDVTINLCTHAAMIDKENYLAHYYKARACHKIGDVPDALESYDAVISLKPDFGFVYFQRSSLLISLGLVSFGCHDLEVADSLDVEGAHEALLKYCW